MFSLFFNTNKRGYFKLKNGKFSINYFNMRELFSQPDKIKFLSQNIYSLIGEENKPLICPVPTGAVPLASLVAFNNNLGLIIPRKEKKKYGMGNLIDGKFSDDNTIVILEDVITSGSSIQEVIDILEGENLRYKVIVLFDRQVKKEFSFDYISLYNRTQFMKDKIVSIVKAKKNLCSNNFKRVFEIAVFIIDREYSQENYIKILNYSKVYNFLIFSKLDYEEEKYDLNFGKRGQNLEEMNSLILESKELIDDSIKEKYVGYFEKDDIILDQLVLHYVT